MLNLALKDVVFTVIARWDYEYAEDYGKHELGSRRRGMAKRPGGDVPVPAAKRAAGLMSTLDIGPASGEEDLNIKVLQVRSKLSCTFGRPLAIRDIW